MIDVNNFGSSVIFIEDACCGGLNLNLVVEGNKYRKPLKYQKNGIK